LISKQEQLEREERILYEKQDELDAAGRQLEELQEDYLEQFHSSSRLFEELRESFHQNDFALLFEDLHTDFRQEQHHILEDLEDGQEALKQEQTQAQERLDKLYYEKRKVEMDTEDENE